MQLQNNEKTCTLHFGKIDMTGNGKRDNEVVVSISLRENKEHFPEFSASASVWNNNHTDTIMGGQCLDDIPLNNPVYTLVKDLWKRNHLNGMHAGTALQEDALKRAEKEFPGIFQDQYYGIAIDTKTGEPSIIKNADVKETDYVSPKQRPTAQGTEPSGSGWNFRRGRYEKQCDFLKLIGLYEVELSNDERFYNPDYGFENKPYRYGSGWLYRPIGEIDLKVMQTLIGDGGQHLYVDTEEKCKKVMDKIDEIYKEAAEKDYHDFIQEIEFER